MDWSRAKTVLIAAFLVLNVLLGFQLWTGNRDEQTTSAGMGLGEVQQLMNSKGVKLEAKVPTDTPTLKTTVRFDEKIKPQKQEPLQNPVTDNLKIGTEPLNDRIARQIPNGSEYMMDAALSRKGHYVYNQAYRKLPMFDVRLELFAEGSKITTYTQSYVDIQTSGENREQKVLSALTAIGSLTENYLTSGAVITDVRLGYHGQIYNSETQVLAPFWRIALKSGEIYYVHAINGAVEPPQKGS